MFDLRQLKMVRTHVIYDWKNIFLFRILPKISIRYSFFLEWTSECHSLSSVHYDCHHLKLYLGCPTAHRQPPTQTHVWTQFGIFPVPIHRSSCTGRIPFTHIFHFLSPMPSPIKDKVQSTDRDEFTNLSPHLSHPELPSQVFLFTSEPL